MDRSGQVSWTSPQHATSTGAFFLNFEMDIYNRILHLSNLFYNFTRMFSSLVQVFVANHTSMIDFIILEQMTAFAVIMQKHPGWVGKDPKSSIHLCFLSLRDFWVIYIWYRSHWHLVILISHCRIYPEDNFGKCRLYLVQPYRKQGSRNCGQKVTIISYQKLVF